MSKFSYLKRICSAYILGKKSQLSFWHDTPMVNSPIKPNELGAYYMTFHEKADYKAYLDERGIPLLDYHGTIGKQYNPIAIAQYGLGNCNLFYENKEKDTRYQKIEAVGNWFLDNLVPNSKGLKVWFHHFDFEYDSLLKKPWYSGLAQGQAVSFLLRAYQITRNSSFLNAAKEAFISLTLPVSKGGTLYYDSEGLPWIEEYITDPPTHILNGFIWALWGVYDYFLITGSAEVKDLFDKFNQSLEKQLSLYDRGYWSLYDLSKKSLPNLASPFYHRLHIVQLEVMHQITGKRIYHETSRKWENYANSFFKRKRAFIEKALFKLVYF